MICLCFNSWLGYLCHLPTPRCSQAMSQLQGPGGLAVHTWLDAPSGASHSADTYYKREHWITPAFFTCCCYCWPWNYHFKVITLGCLIASHVTKLKWDSVALLGIAASCIREIVGVLSTPFQIQLSTDVFQEAEGSVLGLLPQIQEIR